MKKITYIGLERCDVVYHLANVLSLQGKVLVVDNSYSADLIRSVSVDGSLGMREWRNVVYMCDVDVKRTDLTEFEYVIDYLGLAFTEDDLLDNDINLIMPDFTLEALTRVKELPARINNPIYILRDQCNKKFTAKSVATLLGVHPKEIAGWITLSVSDLASYIALTHNHISNIKTLSNDFVTAISYIASKVFEVEDEKKMDKIMAAARKIK